MHELWQLQTPLPVSKDNDYNTHFYGYSLGWFVSDVKGYKQVTHTGGLLGTVTQFTLIPELDLGIVVLTNQMIGGAFSSITNTVKDSYLGYEDRNWIKKNAKKNDKWIAKNDSIKKTVYQQTKSYKDQSTLLDAKQVTGTYEDAWFGKVNITQEWNALKITSERNPKVTGELLPYSETTYVAKWGNRSFDADVFVLFNLDEKGKAQSATMKYIAPITDFSFDFGDLHLKRVSG